MPIRARFQRIVINHYKQLLTMKRKHYSVLLLLSVLFIFISCDKTEPPYMELPENPPPDTTECPVPDFPADTHHVRTVLLEDYTGHTCVNCPEAASIAAGLKLTYGEKLVVIAVHSGYFAEPESGNYSLDLRCPAGEELHDHFSITNNPAGIFNRKEIGGTTIFEDPSAWNAQIAALTAVAPEIDMQLITELDETNRKLCCHVRTEFLQAGSKNLNLALYIIEDSIVGYQKNNKPAYGTVPDITNYTFMHVLRGTINGTWGDALSTGSVAAGDFKISSYRTTLNAAWDARHCHVIAIISDSDTKEVLHVVEAGVIE